MEYCEIGSIRDLMDALGHGLKEDQMAVVCLHTLKALIYLHSTNIIHRDVKAANILLTQNAQVKIGNVTFFLSQPKKKLGCYSFIVPLCILIHTNVAPSL